MQDYVKSALERTVFNKNKNGIFKHLQRLTFDQIFIYCLFSYKRIVQIPENILMKNVYLDVEMWVDTTFF